MGESKVIHLAENREPKQGPPISVEREIFTSRKHSMDYFTVDGVILRTGYKSKHDWYLLSVREILDNSVDFLWKHYKGFDSANIGVSIYMNDETFSLTIRNSNEANIPVFSNLGHIFDFEMRYGSKQDVHIISRGMLGDAMKQILSLGYVLLHSTDDGTAFTDNQWEHPLVIAHNGKETRIYLTVDKATQSWEVKVEESLAAVGHNDTIVELHLPIIDEVRNRLDRRFIEKFCRKYSLLTTDISFNFSIIDDITHTKSEEDEHESVDKIADLSKVLTTVPEKGILNIDIPAIHPIAAEWNNSDFVHSYKPEEFKSRITNVHDKEWTKVYDVLVTFREGSNIAKTPANQMSVAKLLQSPNRDKIIEKLFKQLYKALKAPAELSLPYTTNTKKRCAILVERIAKLYDIDTSKKPSYKLVRGFYADDNIRTLQYPCAFEIIAIPFKDPYGPNKDRDAPKSHQFIGAVNYSVSPKNNVFEGDYPAIKAYPGADIMDVLHAYGFQEEGRAKNRLPCIIVGNLITPRRDPQGYDKSSIDTKPFIQLIQLAVEKIAPEIQTYRADGWTFRGRDDEEITKRDSNNKISARDYLKQFLIRDRGLPGVRNDLLGEK